MFATASHLADLRAEVARLERLLEAERARNEALLDRLLERRNVEPLKAALPAPVAQTLPIFTPAPEGITPDVTDALRQSWIDEEANYLQIEQNFPPEQARAMAAMRWATEHPI